MKTCRFRFVFFAVSGLILFLNQALVSFAADMKPDDVVAKHLESVGTDQARAAAKSRVMEGTADYRPLVGGAGNLEGKTVIVSQDDKLQFMIKLNNNLYRGEQFIYDGSNYQVTRTTAGQTRSFFGEFVQVQDVVLREGLLGGALSTAWPLYDLKDRKAKLSYAGMKKVDGVDAIELRYSPKKSTSVDISLFFDAQTFRHIETVYTVRVQARLGEVDPQLANAQSTGVDIGPTPPSTGGVVGVTNETATARQQETRYRLEEHFSDFKAADGLTLPNKYVIHFSQELGNGRTTVAEWTLIANQIMNGNGVDPHNFQLNK